MPAITAFATMMQRTYVSADAYGSRSNQSKLQCDSLGETRWCRGTCSSVTLSLTDGYPLM
ncbi:hypothetical protein RB12317 [Rhodopirellula baltica SH 1]|uniref:Uncharacterized protein n=1 Tax=Rhodopirellula baltica (strain DSM 10527 / NCIMB 13988 / SH1) TaxID=243090 RepID=Q7UIU8_RHOBA|nr:hypothetical protein RB12317 [Rhodopirellula baltica SH 1]